MGIYEPNLDYCNQHSIEESIREEDHGWSVAQIIESNCKESTQFRIDDEGNLYINETLAPGIYAIHIIAVDRFGARWLENQEIEVL